MASSQAQQPGDCNDRRRRRHSSGGDMVAVGRSHFGVCDHRDGRRHRSRAGEWGGAEESRDFLVVSRPYHLRRAVQIPYEAVTDRVKAGVCQTQPLGERPRLQEPRWWPFVAVDPKVSQVERQPGHCEQQHQAHHHLGDLLARLEARDMQCLAARIEVSERGFPPSPKPPAGQEAYGEVKGHWQAVEHHKEQHIVSVEELKKDTLI